MTALETKSCAKCGQTKALDEFYSDPNGKGGRRSVCKVCWRALSKARKQANPEKVKEQYRRYYEVNAERIKAKDRAYRAANKEVWRRFYEKNAEKRKAYTRQYRLSNLDKVNDSRRDWRKNNIEHVRMKARDYAHRRRLLKSSGQFSPAEWREIKQRQGGRCFYCEKKTKMLEIEHVIPLSRGGAHAASNIVAACRPCNAKKGVKDAHEFALERGRLVW